MSGQGEPSTDELRTLHFLIRTGGVQECAQALQDSAAAVDWRLDRLRSKSGLHRVHQIVAWAFENDWFGREQERLVWQSELEERIATIRSGSRQLERSNRWRV